MYSSEEEERIMLEEYLHEDVFNNFTNFLLQGLPALYILIDLTLLIWTAQTIFSAKLSAPPRSLYAVSSYISLAPLNQIIFTSEEECPQGYELLPLKTFPSIESPQLPNQTLFAWHAKHFCGRRSKSMACRLNCNGYCQDMEEECPLTRLDLVEGQLLMKRHGGRAIVALTVTFSPQCLNDYPFFQSFRHPQDYWVKAQDCGAEGSVSSFFAPIDTMDTDEFLFLNKLPLTTPTSLSLSTLGAVLSLSNEASCTALPILQEEGQPDGQYSESLLIVCFVLLVLGLAWLLVGECCVTGYQREKNILVVLLAGIELFAISFLFDKEQALFELQVRVEAFAACVPKDVAAAQLWTIGMHSPTPFIMIQFVTVSFLALFLAATLIDVFLFRQLKISRRKAHSIAQI